MKLGIINYVGTKNTPVDERDVQMQAGTETVVTLCSWCLMWLNVGLDIEH